MYRSRLHNRIKAILTFFRYVARRVPAMALYMSFLGGRTPDGLNPGTQLESTYINLAISSLALGGEWVSKPSEHLLLFALYDIKFLKSCRTLKGGLQDIAEEMGVPRLGSQHQAGSDSLLTGNIFFEMRERLFDRKIDDAKYLGQVWGLNGSGISPPNINGVGTIVYNNGVPVPSTPTTDRNSQNPATPGNTTPSQQQQRRNGQPGIPGQYNLQYGRMG
ncbi:hypothetical protein HOY80DRAFT_1020246 [Tuber brumale]|nr:hypothetical protein HOY80DRAFT_1020246 [Tuber brumale]